MKIVVFTRTDKAHTTLIAPDTRISRWKVLLWADGTVWTDDDDAAVADTEAAVRAEYLVPNGVRAAAMGRLGTRTWWVQVDAGSPCVGEFYDETDAAAADNLAWRTFYTFSSGGSSAAGTDCISTGYSYIPNEDVRAAIVAAVAVA